jgi:hypothetical protein
LPKTSFQSSRTSIVIAAPSTDRGDGQRKTLWSFNSLAKLDLPVDDPEEATLAALKDWKGPHCTIQATVPRREKEPKYQAKKPPAKSYKKTVTPRPYRPKAAARPVPGPRGHRGGDGVGDEQRELQRFPVDQLAWQSLTARYRPIPA